ncbi:MAG: alpha-amylase family glycosyl hydrolase [Termitinemataceae bacterium]|nr:MAG: alpha-amylase family glycosyl hydrolase [Termitinemataceae bacterium]
MKKHWGLLIGSLLARLLTSLDVISEESKPQWNGSPGPTAVYDYGYLQNEYEKFSQDQEWMPRTVLLAKSTLVWLWQLSKKYKFEINRLDLIPDAELDEISRRGFTGLWLIGLWERSNASRTIKQWKGNPEAAASAYSLHDYDIANELGGWGALCNLRDRCFLRGIRLGSDMVPNHTGIDSRWIMEHPDRFLQLDYPPYPQYQYNSGNLSQNGDIVVQIEDHYYDNTDCAVVFHHYDKRNNRHRYIYHGNDGTSMPWNDTAQIDFLNPEAREAVIQTIIGVCKQFSIVRFDAAMTLAKRHIQRLWYPEPGHGGDIASRGEHAISTEEFNRRIPNEFWREVVDRCASEAPSTLLLAEAFWMMEGYFVRTLGMHRVYNSAFMNMLKKEENQKYRATIKNTLEFDPEILKRFVNFMNNPDEETAVAQFGKGDKYFGICTLMVTMPGLPMFGHGQIEGYEEKYGMEYRRAYKDELPDTYLIERHEREIFPLMKRRMIFSGSADFCMFDLWTAEGNVNENVFAYTNRLGEARALVLYNNSYTQTAGWINGSCAVIPIKSGGSKQDNLAQSLLLRNDPASFVLLNEQSSNKWFIRSSKEIYERGLFTMLKGYEAQVYMNIFEVHDPTYKTWARLHAELNGASMKMPQEALEDMLLDEIFGPFCAIFSAEHIEAFRKSITEGTAINKETASAVEKFIETCNKFIIESDYNPFANEKKLIPVSTADALNSWDEFLAGYTKFAKEKSGNDPFICAVDERLNKDDKLAAFIFGWAVINLCSQIAGKNSTGAQTVTLFEYWHFDRKMRESFEAAGIEGSTSYRAIEIAKAVMRRVTPDKAVGFKAIWGEVTAASIIEKSKTDEDFRRLLCVNEWENETWFNKEACEEFIFLGAVYVSGFSGFQKAAGVVKELTAAKDKSSYKLTELLKAVKGKSGSSKTSKDASTAKKTVKAEEPKTAEPKASAKKPEAKKPEAKKTEAKPAAEKKPATEKKPAAKKTSTTKKK